ncbi:MarR family winged helix-turn-helix transcriptional regulator [Ottowia caeni]|uniref:MarR family winged helix-turn-helix transcriptional regulator n=1 Tax=Ottowia caeni TaxID=2870339 RepID=UPI003D74BC2A
MSDQTELGGPSFPQWVPLHKVHLGHANTVAELARQCSLDAGAMTRLLDRLESKGLCRRVRSEKDRRVVHIELTPQGLEAAERVPEVLCRVYNQALEGFSRTEWEQLQKMLWRLIGNAERMSQESASSVGRKSAKEGAE